MAHFGNNCTVCSPFHKISSTTTNNLLVERYKVESNSNVYTAEAVILIIVFLGCIIGNSLMCFVVFKDKTMRSCTYALLANLAIADLGLGLFSMPFTVVTLISKDWVMGELLCNINGFMNAFWIPAIVFSTTCISMHKYFSICDPFNPQRTQKRIRIFVIMTWVLSLLCGLGPLVGWNKFTHHHGSTQCGLADPSSSLDFSYMIFLAVVVFGIPMLLNILAFWLMFKTVRRHSLRLEHNVILGSCRTDAQRRTATTFFIVFVSYVVCWAPFFVYGVLKVAKIKENISGQYLTASYILGFSNTVHNPIIFAFRNRSFRESFWDIFSSICGRFRRRFRSETITTGNSIASFLVFSKRDAEFNSTWYLPDQKPKETNLGRKSIHMNAFTIDDNCLIVNEIVKNGEDFVQPSLSSYTPLFSYEKPIFME